MVSMYSPPVPSLVPSKDGYTPGRCNERCIAGITAAITGITGILTFIIVLVKTKKTWVPVLKKHLPKLMNGTCNEKWVVWLYLEWMCSPHRSNSEHIWIIWGTTTGTCYSTIVWCDGSPTCTIAG